MHNLEETDRFLEKFNRRNRNYEQPNYKHWNWSCGQKSPPKMKAQDQIASQENSIKHAYPSKTLSKNCRGRNPSKLILRGHHHPDTKTGQRQNKIRKLQANITDEDRCKNPQQNFFKPHQKAHTPWSSWVYSRDARILQYMQINQCDIPN